MKKGDLVSSVEFLRVDDTGPDWLILTNVDTGTTHKLKGKPLIDALNSSGDSETKKKVTKTALAEKLSTCYNVVFTVCFEKLDGTERVLRGRLVAHEPLMGRSKCEDLDLPSTEHRLRQVDHRTIKWLIVDKVKYEVKK